MKNKTVILEYINAIEQNYPPENYTALREALDYCLCILKEKAEDSNNPTESVKITSTPTKGE